MNDDRRLKCFNNMKVTPRNTTLKIEREGKRKFRSSFIRTMVSFGLIHECGCSFQIIVFPKLQLNPKWFENSVVQTHSTFKHQDPVEYSEGAMPWSEYEWKGNRAKFLYEMFLIFDVGTGGTHWTCFHLSLLGVAVVIAIHIRESSRAYHFKSFI